MTTFLEIIAGWMVLSVTLGIALGRILRRAQTAYPEVPTLRIDPHDGETGWCPQCSCPDCDYPLGTSHAPECATPTLQGV